MKRTLALIIALFLASLGAQTATTEDQALLDNTLDKAARSLDALMMDTLASLERIAQTPTAQAGDWPGMKPYLQLLELKVPAVYFYALPDGNYYTGEKDFTNLNISNREYFPTLMSGGEVYGFPLYSRSTGKKSAVMACSVQTGGNVTGALGASVYLDELRQKVESEIELPDNYTWFVVNQEGMTILHKDVDYIFMNALTQGGPSLKAALEQALLAQSGNIRYDLGGILRKGKFQKLPNLDWWVVMAKMEGQPKPPPARMELSLQKFVPRLQNLLDEIDLGISKNLAQAGEAELDDLKIRSLLADIHDRVEYAINVCFVDKNGILHLAEPADYKNVEGSDISAQAHVAAMIRDHRPLMSGAFIAVEGFDAVVISRPLKDRDGEFLGCISALLRPELLIRGLLKDLAIPPEYDLWIMQTDGRIVYDRDTEEIGRMLFSDPLYAGYASLLKLGQSIATEPWGIGEYIFESSFGKQKQIKEASWSTVQLHQTEWRVVITYLPYEKH